MPGLVPIWNGKGKSKNRVGRRKREVSRVAPEEIDHVRKTRAEIQGASNTPIWKHGRRQCKQRPNELYSKDSPGF